MSNQTTEAVAEDYLRRLCRRHYVYTHIEPTNACNADCAICPRDAMTRKLLMMTWPTFVQIMDTVLPTPIPMLAIVGFGEPTLHRQILEMISYARSARSDLAIKITTNGSRMSADNLDKYFEAGLDLVEISVFGYSPETYEAQMEGLKFRHVERLISALNERGCKYSLSTVRSDEVPAAVIQSFWTSVGASRLSIKGLHRRGGYLELDEPVTREQALGNYRQRSQVLEGGLPEDACHKLYMFLHVNAAGQILPCVQEINMENVLGRISRSSSLQSVMASTRSHRPTFNICAGCELKQQDLMDYYARFFATQFPERLPIWLSRLKEAEARQE